MPAFVACLAFGEMAKELLLSSTRAMPKKLMDTGYQFRHSDLEEAFMYLLGKADNS
jgi:NAD dependent epimerase/dehydratase family enzyme